MSDDRLRESSEEEMDVGGKGADEAPRVAKLGRRRMLMLAGSALGAAGLGAGALGLGFLVGRRHERRLRQAPPRTQPFSPNAFIAIDTDNQVTLWVTRSEMGQGVSTALPMILAEELGADWLKVRFVLAPASAAYGNQATMASASVRSMYGELREAGSVARHMLEEAAATSLQVPAGECFADMGWVVHGPSGRRLRFGSLVERAAELPVPDSVSLRSPEDFRLIGQPLKRLDAPMKVRGEARYGLDVRRPEMLHAVLAQPPWQGARLQRGFDDTACLAVPGVERVLMLDVGVAVVAQHTWAAMAGRDALSLTWHAPSDVSTASHVSALEAGLESEGAEAFSQGDAPQGLASSARKISATYMLPLLAHACMEPINITAEITEERCQIWAPTQHPQGVRELCAALCGLSIEQVQVHVTFLGGGFGRRAEMLETRQVVELAQALSPRPVQLVWSREDATRHDYYRHSAAHQMEVGIDEAGMPVAWVDRMASPSMGNKRASEGEVDDLAVDGARDLPYDIPHRSLHWQDVAVPLKLGIWRSVGYGLNVFAVESMLDEVASVAELDPLELRLSLLSGKSAHSRVLERVAEQSDWHAARAAGRHLGLAFSECFGSLCAQVAEVERRGDSGPWVLRRVWAAVDCGQIINPNTVEAQIEGGIVFGLSAALSGKIDLRAGQVVQSNFHDYCPLRFSEMPEVHVAIIDSDGPPGGVGELGVPAIAPALCAALHSATGIRHRMLPISG